MASADYSEMIEMPVSTCEMVVSPEKKKVKKDDLVKRINKKLFGKKAKRTPAEDISLPEDHEEPAADEAVESNIVVYEKKKPEKFKFDVVAAQVVAIFALVVAILLTPCSADRLMTEDGIMTVAGECAVYPLAEGEVESVYEADGKFAVTVSHSNNFKSVITGMDLSYVALGDKIYTGIPVGFVKESAKVMMYDGEKLIKNFTVGDGGIVWES